MCKLHAAAVFSYEIQQNRKYQNSKARTHTHTVVIANLLYRLHNTLPKMNGMIQFMHVRCTTYIQYIQYVCPILNVGKEAKKRKQRRRIFT